MAPYPSEKPTDTMPISGIGYYLDDNDPEIARALRGSPFGFKVQEDNATRALNTLSDLNVAQRTVIIELNSSYDLSQLRDDVFEIDGATVSSSPTGEHELNTNTAGTGSATLNSTKSGRYVPGYPSEIGIGFRIAPNQIFEPGQTLNWGGIDSSGDNALLFGYDDNGFFVNRKNLGVDNKVYQSDWNVDPLDGTGESGYTLNPEIGNIYRIEYTWYGFGEIRLGVIGETETGNQVFIPCHKYNEFNETSIAKPNLKIHVSAENGGATSNITAFVGGRQYSVLGKYIPKFRYVDDFASKTITTDPTPIVSFRKKSNGYAGRSIILEGYDLSTTDSPILLEFFIKTTLTGASFGNPDSYTADEVSVESDTAATSVDTTNAVLIYRKLIPNSAAKNEVASIGDVIDYVLGDDINISMTARTLTGTADVVAQFRMKEEW